MLVPASTSATSPSDVPPAGDRKWVTGTIGTAARGAAGVAVGVAVPGEVGVADGVGATAGGEATDAGAEAG